MVPYRSLASVLGVSGLLLAQLIAIGSLNPTPETMAFAGASAGSGEIVQKRTIAPGERTVLTVKTSGVVEVVIFEHTGEPELLGTFQAGRVPRTAKVFTNIKELAYPLASDVGADFYVRVRPLAAGRTTLHYEPGTISRAMAQLRGGSNLTRNRGTAWVRSGLHQMPVYQLVPGTVIRVEILTGQGTVALLKTRDYLAVRDGKVAVVSRCAAASCVRSATGGKVLELSLHDYDDRYLVAVAEGAPLTFSYQVIATPEVVDYITSCT